MTGEERIATLEAELETWISVFGHLGKTADEAGNAINRRLKTIIDWRQKAKSVLARSDTEDPRGDAYRSFHFLTAFIAAIDQDQESGTPST